MNNEDFYYLFSGENREVSNIVIHQPRIKELIKYDVDVDKLIEPFFAFVDLCDMSDEDKCKFKNLDLIFYDHIICEKENCMQKSMLEALKSALVYICRTQHVEYSLHDETISINGIEKINRDNFDDLQRYVLSIFYAKKPKPPKIKENQKSKVAEMQKKLAMHRKKKELTIPNIIKVVQNGGDVFVPHKDILEFTYWQLMDRYSDILKIDSCKTYQAYKLSPKYEMKDDNKKHWTEEIKLEIE